MTLYTVGPEDCTDGFEPRKKLELHHQTRTVSYNYAISITEFLRRHKQHAVCKVKSVDVCLRLQCDVVFDLLANTQDDHLEAMI